MSSQPEPDPELCNAVADFMRQIPGWQDVMPGDVRSVLLLPPDMRGPAGQEVARVAAELEAEWAREQAPQRPFRRLPPSGGIARKLTITWHYALSGE
jgi:hypothetical protein